MNIILRTHQDLPRFITLFRVEVQVNPMKSVFTVFNSTDDERAAADRLRRLADDLDPPPAQTNSASTPAPRPDWRD
jgi:hypothetical protein